MQLNYEEIRQIEGVVPALTLPSLFQIPGIHESVPCRSTLVKFETDFVGLARNLLDAEVINPDDLSDNVTCPRDIVDEGLRAWFMRRIGGIQHIRFDVQIVDATEANNLVENPNGGNNWTGGEFTGPAFAVMGAQTELRYVEDIARLVEKQVPGLFLTAFAELMSAGYKTVEFSHPGRVLENEAQYSLWDEDIYSVEDESAREALQERYGEDCSDYYMPDQMLEAYGNGFCMDIARRGRPKPQRPRFSMCKLKKLSHHENKHVASIASGLIDLRQAVARVDELGATFKSVSSQGLDTLYVGTVIFFNNDDRCSHFADQGAQFLWENGEGSGLHAIEQLPASAAELKTYFQNLDALFRLLAQMDALIPAISYHAYAEE
jgi:PRTRC genetic system protein F